MVLESALTSREVEKKPLEMFIYSILMAFFSLAVAYFIFPSEASVVFLFIITLSIAPVIYNVLKDEEQVEEDKGINDATFLETHEDVLKVYANFFLGAVFALSLCYTVLPDNIAAQVFETQISTVRSISTGPISIGGAALSSFGASDIFFNNIKVLLICFFMSFFFGTGAIFILSWNASIISVFIGTIARGLSFHASSPFYAYLYALPTGFLSIALHGVPEIMAYCIGGMAGGILSAGVIRNKKLDIVLRDSMMFLFVASLIIFASAGIEAYITPLL